MANSAVSPLALAILALLTGQSMLAAIDNCPMRVVRHIIARAAEATARGDAPLQMQVIRRIMEDIYGGAWGVLIIKEPELISTAVHWTFPDHRHKDGSAAFCLHLENGWQYNVFKTGDSDTEERMTVEQVIEQMNRLVNSTSKGTAGSSRRAVGDSASNARLNSFSNSLVVERKE